MTSDIVCYESHILPSAQRDIKKLPSIDLKKSILNTCTDELETNPRPHGYEPVKGQEGRKDLYPVYSEDRKYRIIYCILDRIRAVIIVSVRRRNEGSYKDIPTKSLSDKLKEIEAQVKAMVPLIRDVAGQIGSHWMSNLNDNQVRCLEIGIKAIRENRGSASSAAKYVNDVISVDESVKTIAKGMTRLLKEMEKREAFLTMHS